MDHSIVPRPIHAALTEAGFEVETSDEAAGAYPATLYVRSGNARETKGWKGVETLVVADRRGFSIQVFSEALEAHTKGLVSREFGTVALIASEGPGDPPVLAEHVHRAVATPRSIVGAVGRVLGVAAALLRGEEPAPAQVPTDELTVRMQAMVTSGAARIEKGVVQITHVMSEAEAPSITYTIGLRYLGDHPELVIAGLPMPVGNSLLRTLSAIVVETGRRLDKNGQRIKGVAAFPLEQVSLPRGIATRVLRGAVRFDTPRRIETTAVQLIYPDPAGLFPYSAGYCLPRAAQDLSSQVCGVGQERSVDLLWEQAPEIHRPIGRHELEVYRQHVGAAPSH